MKRPLFLKHLHYFAQFSTFFVAMLNTRAFIDGKVTNALNNVCVKLCMVSKVLADINLGKRSFGRPRKLTEEQEQSIINYVR